MHLLRQRIQLAKIESDKEAVHRRRRGRHRVSGRVPDRAIVFGNANDPKSRVAQLKGGKRNYGLLADLNTQPRTTYLSSLRNPNEEITGKAQKEDHARS